MKKLRWGVIGAGGIADRRTLPGMMLSEEAELIAVMEINEELAENLRVKYGAKRAYTDHKSLLADPEVDVVYIASPVNFHKEQAIDAARAKKDILLEKPICLDIVPQYALFVKSFFYFFSFSLFFAKNAQISLIRP